MNVQAAQRDASPVARRPNLFWKLFFSAAVLALVVTGLLTWIFLSAYRTLLYRELEQRLASQAGTIAAVYRDRWPAEASEAIQSEIRRLGEHTGLRISLIDIDGRIIADSTAKDLASILTLEDHSHRSEVAAAMHSGHGDQRRRSPTLGVRFQYHAERVDVSGAPVGVVRTAAATAALEAEVEGLVRWAWAIGLLVSLVTMAIAYWLLVRLTEPLRALVASATALAAGQLDRRPSLPTVSGDDEIGAAGAALTEIARRLAQREKQLASTSEMHATVLEAMTESVIAVDRADRVLFANAAASRMFEFKASGAQSLSLLEAVRSHELRAVVHKALRSRQLCNAEVGWRGKTHRVFDALVTPLPGNPPPGVVVVLRDVTELKRLDQMRQQFVANVSHELKTPLSSIKAYTETLLGGAKDDPVHCERFLQRIEEQAGHLHQLILDMLSLARIESNPGLLELTNVRVAKVVERCLADYEGQAAARGVALDMSGVDGELEARADAEALRQILSNLVDNAIKYTPSGGTVAVRARADSGAAVIEVDDEGVGIAPEHHPRLFERFYRVDRARSRELGGTGLGLSIVKHLAQAMNGTVALESQVGEGALFRVRLPLSV